MRPPPVLSPQAIVETAMANRVNTARAIKQSKRINADAGAAAVTFTPPPPPLEPPPAPPPPQEDLWSEHFAGAASLYKGTRYWHNAATGESQWTKPEGL